MTEICRTCLQEISSNSVFYYLDVMDLKMKTITIRCKLVDFIPEMDLDVVPNSVICNKCFESLTIAHEFKNKCLETEGKIQSYIEQMGYVLTSVNLGEIVRRTKESHASPSIKTNLNNSNSNEPDHNTSGNSLNYKNSSHESIADLQCDTRTIFALPKIAQLLAAAPNASSTGPTNFMSLMCNECTFQATNDLELKTHHKISHSDKQNYIHKCTECMYTAPKRQALIIHMRKQHAKDQLHFQPFDRVQFDCQTCDFKSTDTRLKYDLSKQCSVTKRTEKLKRKKPYKCKLCDYASSRKTNLMHHLKFHNGRMTLHKNESKTRQQNERESVFYDENVRLSNSNNSNYHGSSSGSAGKKSTPERDRDKYETAVKNEMIL